MGWKDAAENAVVVYEKVKLVREWASLSATKSLLIAGLLGVVLSIGYYGYIVSLIAQEQETGQTRNAELKELQEELSYRVALDAINACIDTPASERKLHTWYCEQAAIQYQSHSAKFLPEKVHGLLGIRAFSAMRNDVSDKLRSIEFNRILHATATPERKRLDLLLNTTVMTIVTFASLILFVGSYLFLRLLPTHNRNASSAANAVIQPKKPNLLL